MHVFINVFDFNLVYQPSFNIDERVTQYNGAVSYELW
jgi:hypothetical protein